MRFPKIKPITGILGAILIIAVLFVAVKGMTQEESSEQQEEQEYAYHVKTTRFDPGLDYTFEVTGEVAVGQKANIVAERKATVRDVFVKQGDEVKTGDLLLSLYSESLESSFLTTQVMYANAQASLATTQAVANNQVESERLRLETAELQLQNTLAQNSALKKQAEEGLAAAKLNSSLSITSAETGLETAKKSYEKTKAVTDANLRVAQTGLENAIRSVKTAMFTGLNTANELLDVSSEFRGSAGQYKDLISTRSTTAKEEAERSLKAAIEAYQSMTDEPETVISAGTATADALDDLLTALNLTIPKGVLTQATLSGFIASASQSLATVEGGVAGIQSAMSSYEATKSSVVATLTQSAQQVEIAQNALNQAKQESNGSSQNILNAEAQYAATLAQLKTSEDSMTKAVESARLAYANAQRSASLTVLNAQNATVSAKDALDQMQISMDKLSVHATFDGQVAEIPVKLGDEINAGSTMIILDNPETIKVVVGISQEEKERIQVGDPVGLGSVTGTILSIGTSADPATKKFTVEIDPGEADFNPGQFIRVTFTATKGVATDRIYLPITAVTIANDQSTVWSVVDSRAMRTPVVLGNIQGDRVEILEGVTSDMEIIIEGGRIIEKDGSLIEVIAE